MTLLPLLLVVLAQADAGLPAGAARFPVQEIRYVEGTPPFPPSVKVAVLEGDPAKEGLFTVRLRIPAGVVLPLHTHPTIERSTVLSGTIYVGFSATPDKKSGTRLEAGSYYVNPKDVPHWFMTETEVVLQITTTGPWGSQKR